MFSDLNAALIIHFHDSKLIDPTWLHPEPESQTNTTQPMLWDAIGANHKNNCLLWQEEDLARRTQVADAAIAANKRAIDRFNQQRNDATERVDEFILHRLASITPTEHTRLNSETAGSMIDRLSILSLKIFHMEKQTHRDDVDISHIQTCQSKLDKLNEQRHDLGRCLDQLLHEARQGRAYYKIYRQFKMYNDPKLNPQLYGEAT